MRPYTFEHFGQYIRLIKAQAAGGMGLGVYTALFAEAAEVESTSWT